MRDVLDCGTTAVALIVLLLATSCHKDEPRAPEEHDAEEAAAVDDHSFRFAPADRVVAFGDVHGDVQAARAALRLAGAIDRQDRWIGGKLVVVQTGDLLDRGDDDAQVVDLFEKLIPEATAAGGAFHVLDGNHEVMNVQGDFRYVTEGGFRAWAGTAADGLRAQQVDPWPPEQRGRAAAFLPGGPVAKQLAEHPIAIAVGPNVFVHGGLLEAHVRYGIGHMNRNLREWMRGERAQLPKILADESAPFWSRAYSEGTPSVEVCGELDRVLGQLAAKRMIVGHTVQKDHITSACGAKVWRIDVGLSKFYGGKPSVLEIEGDSLRAIDQFEARPAAESGIAPAQSGAKAQAFARDRPAVAAP